MSENGPRVEVITGAGRRRHWPLVEKLRIVEVTHEPGATISVVARRKGAAPNLLYRQRRLMAEGGAARLVAAAFRA